MELLLNSLSGRQLKKTFFVAFIERKENQYSLKEVVYRYYCVLTFSSLIQHVFDYPLDRLRTVAFTDFSKLAKKRPVLTWNYILRLIENEGILKLYKGFRFSILATFPKNLVVVGVFAVLREKWGLGLFNAVFVGSTVANLVLYPLDTALIRFQADSLFDKTSYKYNSVLTVFTSTMEKEGWRGFYRGFPTAVLHGAMSISLYTLVFKGLFKSQTTLH